MSSNHWGPTQVASTNDATAVAPALLSVAELVPSTAGVTR